MAIPGPAASHEGFNLGAYHQQQYQAAYQAALAAGHVQPLVLPWSVVGSFFLPLLYLSIPHTTRPWLYRLRWAVAAAVVWLNVRLVRTTSAANEAVAYTVGLLAVWGTLWALRLLVFTRPQWDAARVQRRLRRKGSAGLPTRDGAFTPTAPDESVALALPDYEYFWQPFPAHASFAARLLWTADLLVSWRGAGWNFAISAIPHPPSPSLPLLRGRDDGSDDELVRMDLIPYMVSRTGTTRSLTYAAFFRTRLCAFVLSYLTIDLLAVTMRWDPYFILGPNYLHPYTYPPQGSHSQHTRYPYPLQLPALYSKVLPLPNLTVLLVRNLCGMAGILAGIQLHGAALQLIVVGTGRLYSLGHYYGNIVFRRPSSSTPPPPLCAELWQHPALFGGFVPTVLDRGLAGFWGGYWHQTFRVGFVAPARWLLTQNGGENVGVEGKNVGQEKWRREKTNQDVAARVLEMVFAFSLSGILHATGGKTSIPSTTVAWAPFAFFASQPLGIALQQCLQQASQRILNSITTTDTTDSHIRRLPPSVTTTMLRRAANLLFTLAWLHLTGAGIVDDMSRAGVWMYEPVPVSPLRMMGLGGTGDDGKWWRWGSEAYGLGWYRGRYWWESGVTL
ncbi:uncharacterized protein C8A04DRAFT_13280 [Dichotomopilus funicola]|uniref:Wax synthase domain-containing protein n=1 Tax=Dichotomopilus funicola TaxID=1934379 RepID=A0AAN6ZK79_9PEZI|nr:hypothetical protein C8A04DRAFT_13280 [Dichotomopilus funicola]